jgi:hypothetical protein
VSILIRDDLARRSGFYSVWPLSGRDSAGPSARGGRSGNDDSRGDLLDGQHRIEGLKGYDGPRFDLNVTIFVGADVDSAAPNLATNETPLSPQPRIVPGSQFRI